VTTVVTRADPTAGALAGFGDFVRSEWTKIRSVRSTYWTLITATLLSIGIGVISNATFVHHYRGLSAADQAGELVRFDAVSHSTPGVAFGQIAIGVLGVLVMSSEYRNRMIRTTLSAAPRRGTLLLAKATAFGALAIVVGQLIAFASFFCGMQFLSGASLSVSLSDPGVLRAVVGVGIYMALVGFLGLGLGAIVRHTAGAISALVVFLLILPTIAQIFPHPWDMRFGSHLPFFIGEQSGTARHLTDHLAPVTGLVVFALYAAVMLSVGAVLLSRRDA